MVVLPKDSLIDIFSYLSAKDVINVSLVNHEWYRASSDNHLWFDLCQREIKKIKGDYKIRCYCSKVNFKLLYLGMFHQKYNSQIVASYKSFLNLSWKIFKKEPIIGSLVIIGSIPFGIVCIPFCIGIEIYSNIKHNKKQFEFCDCESCYNKGVTKGKKILKYYGQ